VAFLVEALLRAGKQAETLRPGELLKEAVKARLVLVVLLKARLKAEGKRKAPRARADRIPRAAAGQHGTRRRCGLLLWLWEPLKTV
jgi:hypothetical protein